MFEGQLRRILEDVSLSTAPHDSQITHPLERGQTVEIGDIQDEYTFVRHRADLDWEPLYPQITGWLKSSAIQPSRVERHIFHLQTTSPTPDQWELISDGGRLFKPYWVNISEDPNLIEPQAIWWQSVRAAFLQS